MKILTIATTKDAFRTLPESEQNKLMKGAVRQILEIQKRMGDKIQFYSEVGWGRTVSIGEHSSVEEYQQCIQTPLAQAGFVNYETYLLAELDEKAIKAYVDSP